MRSGSPSACTPWLDEDGQVGGLVNSALEVHELKVTTEALRAANQKIFSHMENSPLAVVELDAQLGLCIAPVAPPSGLAGTTPPTRANRS